MKIHIDDSIKKAIPNCRLGYVVFDDVAIKGTPPALTREFIELQAQVAQMYNIDVLNTVPRISSVRNMYKKLDFDPSRYRPSSEALIRRIIQKKGLYYINSAVDVNNYCSIKYLMPFGLYDLGRIQGDIVYRLAYDGSYTNIAGKTVSTDGKPFLTDDQGPFGNPISDAHRTAVTLTARSLLMVIYADEDITDLEIHEALNFSSEMMIRYNNGNAVIKDIVHG